MPQMKIILLICFIILIFGYGTTKVLPLELNETAIQTTLLANLDWQKYKKEFNKAYANPFDEMVRMEIFESNRKQIEEHNARYVKGQESYEQGFNHLSDMTIEEVRKYYGHSQPSLIMEWPEVTFAPSDIDLPVNIDWREMGYVSDVKDQGSCKSSWAFSALGSLEGQYKHKTGMLLPLSVQNLIDCSTDYGNSCEKGFTNKAFEYVIEHHGIATEESYPYEAKERECRISNATICTTHLGYVSLPEEEKMLKMAVAKIGPISAVIHATDKFYKYKKGIFYDAECSSKKVDHAVLVVGYGKIKGSKTYFWIVKNSWGTNWGMDGYIQMARNRKNNCGIASMTSFPTNLL